MIRNYMKYMMLALMGCLWMSAFGQATTCFSISETQKVMFAQGNLRYLESKDRWSLLDYQHLEKASSGTTAFGWATSGYNGMKGNLDSPRNTDFGPATGDLDGSGYDWGLNNKIYNGDIYSYRTLNAEEWRYLLYKRDDASKLRGKAKVNGIPGLVLLPDDWVQPDNVTFTPGEKYAVNDYSLVLWARMELAGAVFLPAAGYGWDGSMEEWHETGYYWTTTTNDDQTAFVLKFNNQSVTVCPAPRRYGAAVRLVTECK